MKDDAGRDSEEADVITGAGRAAEAVALAAADLDQAQVEEGDGSVVNAAKDLVRGEVGRFLGAGGEWAVHEQGAGAEVASGGLDVRVEPEQRKVHVKARTGKDKGGAVVAGLF